MPFAESVIGNLERSARLHADSVAVTDGAGDTDYSTLWRWTTSLAGHLRREGLQPGDRVAIVLDNSAEAAAAYYGVLAAGGIAVTLNAAAKGRDFAAWLAHCGATWLIAATPNPEIDQALTQLPAPPQVVRAGQGRELSAILETEPSMSPLLPAGQDTPAVLLYTSGTTGSPKGVLLSHGNLAANTDSILQYLGLRATDSIVSVLPFYYSYGSSVLHTHVKAGGRLVLHENLVYPHRVVEALARERATGFAGVPSTFALLLSRVALADYDLDALRYLTQAGGPMSPALTSRVRQALPHARLFVMYGQTEATARLTYLPPDRLDEKLGSAGIGIPGVEISVRREDGVPAALLEDGEVWARGPNVMLGYWHDEAATAAVIREGWLRTGDVGHLDADGFLFLAGRRTDMIKTGAHRVHPKDVEEAIQEIDGIAEVAVVGIDDELLGQSIKAFVVPAPGADIDAMQVRAHCRARLANYKVPKFVEMVDSLPKTTSGKVRKHELTQRKTQP